MSTQQDIYAAGSENCPPMLNKENCVPWLSRVLRYAKSRPNGKLIHNSIINGPYFRRMIPEPGDLNREVPMNETFHVQTDDELTEKELKQIEADDQAIQTILLGLPEDIYAVVDSCETAQEIWLRVQQMMKGSDIRIQEKKAKLFNEWERFTSTNGESTESYYHRFLKLMNDLKRNKQFSRKDLLHQDQPSFNQNYMQQPMPNLEDIIDPTTAMNMALAVMAKALKLNYSTPTNNNQIISSNLRNRNQVIQNVVQNPRIQNVGNQNGQIVVPGTNQNPNGNGNLVAARAEGNKTGHNGNQIRCYNCRGFSHFARNCTVRPRRRDAAYLQTRLLIAQKEKTRIQLQAEEFDLIAAAANLDEIEEVNVNYGSAEVHNPENCYDNEIFNMFTQKEQYSELLEPIPEPHQVPQNDNNVISEGFSVEQSGGTVEQHTANVEKTCVLYDSLYNNLAIEVEKVNTVNRKLSETNVALTTDLARYKIKKDLTKQLSVEKSTVSSLFEEKKKLKFDFKIRENELLDKQIQLEKKIKELDNILVKTGQSIQTIYMLSPKPDSFYHTEQKMALGYQNPFYLKQAQQKQQSLYDGKVLFEKHDPPVVHDSEETSQLAQESYPNMFMVRQLGLFQAYDRKSNASHNFAWKFLGTVRFENDHIAAILGFGDLQWGNILITRVYFVEGLGHNLFSVRQFCDSDLEVAFRRNTCFIRNLEGVDLLKRNRTTNLYTINLHEMASTSLICLMARATSTKSKDEAPEVIKTFLKRITVLLQSPVIIIRTDNDTEFKNQTLVEAARTMLIFSLAPLFLWAEAIATECFTQNRSIIHRRFNKTPYDLINRRKPDISFLNVFGALCIPRIIVKILGSLVSTGYRFLVQTFRVILFSIYSDEWKSFQSQHQTALRGTITLSWKPCNGGSSQIDPTCSQDQSMTLQPHSS
nr:integrase, catalytic region, zinc finger, CCHC-type, peptidase aspartic, catalytic [Tanacetum cinerariifolium]